MSAGEKLFMVLLSIYKYGYNPSREIFYEDRI